MCFSAGASFTSSVVISAIGAATYRKAGEPSQKAFAAIPLLFAMQQFSEGVLWITLRSMGHPGLQSAAMYLFLILALMVWPVMIPWSVYRMETSSGRKRKISWLVSAGMALSLYYACCLFRFHVRPDITGFHVQYLNDFPVIPGYIAFAVYVAVTIVPLFLSTVRKMWVFGTLITVSCLVTGIFYKEFLTSVWCFFAAAISGVNYIIIRESATAEKKLEYTMAY
jgi:hypothetical protein